MADKIVQLKNGNESAYPVAIKTISNINGTALKFADGTMIQVGEYSANKETNIAMSNGGYSTSGTNIPYPIAFNSIYNFSVISKSDTNDNGFIINKDNSDVSKIAGFWWTINSNTTAVEHTLSYIAIGSWK